MNTNVEPVLKVIAGIFLLHNPWGGKNTTVNETKFYFVCSLTSFAVSTLRPINALAARSCSSVPIKEAESLLPTLFRHAKFAVTAESMRSVLHHCQLSTDKVNAAAPEGSNANPGKRGCTQCLLCRAITSY